MPAYTYLGQEEHTTPTKNTTLNGLLAEVRQATGEDWRIAERVFLHRRLLRKPREITLYELFVGTTASEFQAINFYREHDWSINLVNSAELVAAYLHGLLAGRHRLSRAPLRVVK